MSEIAMKDLTPKKMVELFDRYVYGQADAKAILAVAMRNRWRLCRLDKDARIAVVKQNILLSGPTGSGKTALLRVLKNHFGLPVHEIDITEYTETGYVGKEVASIIKDLFTLEIPVPDWYKNEWLERQARDQVAEEAAKPAEKKEEESGHEDMPMVGYATKALLALQRTKLFPTDHVLTPEDRKTVASAVSSMLLEDEVYDAQFPELLELKGKFSIAGMNRICNGGWTAVVAGDLYTGRSCLRKDQKAKDMAPAFPVDNMQERWDAAIGYMREQIRSATTPPVKKIVGMAGISSKVYQLRSGGGPWNTIGTVSNPFLEEMIRNNPALAEIFGNKGGIGKINGSQAREEEWRQRFIEDYGVVFVDEIDKLAESNDSSGKDRVSRTGVQRSLLKALEGEDGHRYNTLNILWIAAGSFANQPITRLMPELQGRLPLRAKIKPLDKAAYVQILKLPTSVFNSARALLEVDGVKVELDEETYEVIAEACEIINKGTADLGARRLGDLVNELFMPAFYEPDLYAETGYNITGKKAKWLLANAKTVVKQYVESIIEHNEKNK